MPKEKSKAALEEEVNSGHFPPYICYQILYSLPEERRVMPTFLKVDLHGANKPLTFICRFKEAESECPGLYLLRVYLYMRACIIHLHVYLVYMLAIWSLLVTQILYYSIVHIFDLYFSGSATSVYHSPPHTPQRTAGWCHVYVHTYVYIMLYVYTVSATAIMCLPRVHRVVCTFPYLTWAHSGCCYTS